MNKVLWLTSWYPNKTDLFTGDFIQRHAQATSLFDEVIVLHVVKTKEPFFSGKIHEEIHRSHNLTEHILYYTCSTVIEPLNRIISTLKYNRYLKGLAKKYITNHQDIRIMHLHVALKAGLTALWVKRKFGFPAR